MSDTEDDPEDSVDIEFDASSIPQFEEHATAIGYICLYWAHLEQVLNAMLELLIPMHDRDVSRCLTSNIDFREKIQVAIGLGYMRKAREDWFDALQKQLNYIDNDLRPERNRTIHDTWDWRGPEIIRRQYATKLSRPQARQPQVLTVEIAKPVPIGELWGLAFKIFDASSELSALNNEYLMDAALRPK